MDSFESECGVIAAGLMEATMFFVGAGPANTSASVDCSKDREIPTKNLTGVLRLC